MNRSDEAISATRNGFYEPWSFSSITEGLTKPLDRIVYAVIKIDEGV
jgi:hypothetical protein